MIASILLSIVLTFIIIQVMIRCGISNDALSGISFTCAVVAVCAIAHPFVVPHAPDVVARVLTLRVVSDDGPDGWVALAMQALPLVYSLPVAVGLAALWIVG